MYRAFSFDEVLVKSERAAWAIEDVIPAHSCLDFTRPFLPESLAPSGGTTGFDQAGQRTLNQIRGHEYLSIFGLVEEFILPFVLDHARPQLSGGDIRVRALLNFASEEAKHIHLFRIFRQRFAEGFGTECAVIGPGEAIAAEVLRHDPLATALVILHIEWMTQRHYLESVRDDGDLDPLFKSLLRHHWIEEAQHAKLDTLMVEALADGRSAAEIDRAIDEYLEIALFLDGGLKAQTELNFAAFERATGRSLLPDDFDAQHQAARWTYLGSGMTHPNFVGTVAAISSAARDRIAAVAPDFC